MKTNLLLIVALMAFFTACNDMSVPSTLTEQQNFKVSSDPNSGAGSYDYEWSDDEAPTTETTLAAVTDQVNGNVVSKNDATYTPVSQTDLSKIIKTGSMGMKVADYNKSVSAIRHHVNLSGGYIANEGEVRDQYQVSNSITIRVPSKNFEKLMDQISAGADTLYYRNIHTQDVGEEYADLVARLKAKRAVEARYLEILKRADTIPNILLVEDKLRRIQEEIESKEGRIRFLDSKVSMSTVTVQLTQKFDVEPPKPIVAGFGDKFLSALAVGWNGILDVVLGIAVSWPVWLLFAIVGLVARKYYLKRKAINESYA